MLKFLEGMDISKLILHDDYAPIYTAKETKKYQNELKIKRMSHPSYSPDLAPNDFWLISKLKKFLSQRDYVDEYENLPSCSQFLEIN